VRWRRSTSSHRPATPGLTSGLPGVGEGLSARRIIIIIEWIGSVGRRVYAAWRTISAISVLARAYTAVQAGIRRSARPRLGRTEDDADPRMGTARRSEDISSSERWFASRLRRDSGASAWRARQQHCQRKADAPGDQ
jgi:hypothetical protein